MERVVDLDGEYWLSNFTRLYIDPIKKRMEEETNNIVKFYIGIDTMMCPLDDRRRFE